MTRLDPSPSPAAPSTVALALPLAVSACTGSSEGGTNDDPDADVTITFWHGWSADSEVAAIQQTIDAFEDANPNIHVKVVGNITDDKINQALRAGGSSAPDVVSSFTTDNVGQFCTSGAFADLTPFMEESGIDPAETFPPAQLEYTQYEGNQCALPLLSDAYGLYYNKDAFAAAGITEPPKTHVGVRRGRREADQERRGQLLRARLHAELPRLRVVDHALRGAVVADVLHRRREVQRRGRPRLRAGHGVAEGPGRQARRLRQAREVPLHVR